MTSPGSGSGTDTTTTAIPGRSSATKVTDQPDPPPRPGKWQQATVVEIRVETSTAKTFRMALSEPTEYLAGQHMVLRLTAPDGYTASRSYSIASAPDGSHGSDEIELTVERLDDGEVSSFLHDEVVVGDQLEVRGPIGGWFVWRGRGFGPPGRGRLGRGPADGHASIGPPDGEVGSGPPGRLRPRPGEISTTPQS